MSAVAPEPINSELLWRSDDEDDGHIPLQAVFQKLIAMPPIVFIMVILLGRDKSSMFRWIDDSSTCHLLKWWTTRLTIPFVVLMRPGNASRDDEVAEVDPWWRFGPVTAQRAVFFKMMLYESYADGTCAICVELYDMDTYRALPCKHVFCRDCVDLWSAAGNGSMFLHCPICRDPVIKTDGERLTRLADMYPPLLRTRSLSTRWS